MARARSLVDGGMSRVPRGSPAVVGGEVARIVPKPDLCMACIRSRADTERADEGRAWI